jgi:DNA-binding CsgD family transcriptional regulator
MGLAYPAQDQVERGGLGLTPAQSAVLELVRQGLTTARIAVQLRMSPATVEAHVRAAMERLGARTRLQAAAIVPIGIAPRADVAGSPLLDADEHRLLRLLAAGATLHEAALSLHISRRTCARRLASAKAKLGTRTTVEAVLHAARGHVPKVLVAIIVLADALADALDFIDSPLGFVGIVPF